MSSLTQKSFRGCLLLSGKQSEQYLWKLGQGLRWQGLAKVWTAWILRGLTPHSALTNASFVSLQSLTCWSASTCSLSLSFGLWADNWIWKEKKNPHLSNFPSSSELYFFPAVLSFWELEATLRRVWTRILIISSAGQCRSAVGLKGWVDPSKTSSVRGKSWSGYQESSWGVVSRALAWPRFLGGKSLNEILPALLGWEHILKWWPQHLPSSFEDGMTSLILLVLLRHLIIQL